MTASATVTALPFIKSRVYRQLVELVAAGVFYRFRVNPSTGVPSTVKMAQDVITPKGVNANETESTFVPAESKRTPRLDRASISWELVIEFAEAAITEEFESMVCDLDRTRIPAAGGLPQLDIRFERSQFANPPVQQASNGTKVKYLVTVDVGLS